jgi:hypothetical protein
MESICFVLACPKGDQMTIAPTPQAPSSSQESPRRVSWTLTIIALLTAGLGLAAFIIGLVQYVSGQGGTPTNLHFDFLQKVGWDIPVTPPIEVMLIGVLLLLFPMTVALKYGGTTVLWTLFIVVGTGGGILALTQISTEPARTIATVGAGVVVLVAVIRLLPRFAWIIVVPALMIVVTRMMSMLRAQKSDD